MKVVWKHLNLRLKKKMEKQSNTMQCIPSFFVSPDKIAIFVKSVKLNNSGTHTFDAGGKGFFSCNVFGVFF
jgi:hypothetical protein